MKMKYFSTFFLTENYLASVISSNPIRVEEGMRIIYICLKRKEKIYLRQRKLLLQSLKYISDLSQKSAHQDLSFTFFASRT